MTDTTSTSRTHHANPHLLLAQARIRSLAARPVGPFRVHPSQAPLTGHR
jgi:hypothetical protein